MVRAVLITLIALCAAPPEARSQDTKRLADQLIDHIREGQNGDWTFGSGLEDTARTLDLLTRCPRRYNDLDGPFFRRAAERVAAASPTELADGWRVLALAGVITPRLIAAREQALGRLRGQPVAERDRTDWLALRTFDGEAAGHAEVADAPPALAVLLAADPAAVTAPPVDEPLSWARWARAARLRRLVPEAPFPSLPDPSRIAPGDLDALLTALEQVVARHGLEDANAPRPEPPPPPPAKVASPRSVVEALEVAAEWLETHHDEGTFGLLMPGWDGPEPGVTALCLSAAMRTYDMLGRDRPDWIEDGLDYLLDQQKADGSIFTYGVVVYTTSVAMGALIDGDRDGDRDAIERARRFLVDAQADEGEGYAQGADPHYGGVGYGGDERPDLSNTQMALEAAWTADPDADPEFYAKALEFLRLNHNAGELEGHSWPRAGGGKLVSGTDGGATYMPGNSPAGEDEVGEDTYVARSYGSMTYALTKSFLICGLDAYDDRVRSAVRWIVAHYTLETNPGFADPERADDGLYYYYLAMARTLRMVPDDLLIRDDGSQIDWREDLRAHLLTEQRLDGSWVNEGSQRWLEGAPTLCTAFALLALFETES